MHNEKPSVFAYCCGIPAKWVVISPSIAYFYCEICKKEYDSEHNTKPRKLLDYLEIVNKPGVKK